MKNFFFTICCLSALLYAKSSYLPPLERKNIIDTDVQEFIEKEQKKKATVIKRTQRDILGRAKSGNDFAYYVADPQKTMEVEVSYYLKPQKPRGVNARYEVSSIGEKKYWLNEQEVSEDSYFKQIEKLQAVESSDEKVGFTANLSASEIRELLEGSEPVIIGKTRDVIDDDYTNYSVIFSYSQITTHAHDNSYKGNGIGIYYDETSGCPHSSSYASSLYQRINTCVNGVKKHPTGVTTVLHKTSPEAKLYARDGIISDINSINPDNYSPKIEITSHSWHSLSNGVYSTKDQKFDNFVYAKRVVSFAAAGNYSTDDPNYYVGSPGLALNTIAVGAVDPTSGSYKSKSKWKNSNIHNDKPEVANYTDFLFPNASSFTDLDGKIWEGKFGGTSASTPYTAGIYANVLSQHPFLKRHPELAKALFLSSEKILISSASSHDTDNFLHVARKMPCYSSLAWNHRFRYWDGGNSCCFANNNAITFTEQVGANVHYRIAIAWLTSGDYVAVNNSVAQDIDLYIYQNDRLIAKSESANNPFEYVDFTTTSSDDITVKILRYANSESDNVILGYSLWNDI